jgi:hypothetical protein
MNQLILKLSILLYSFGFSVLAQDATVATGGNGNGSNGTVSFSVGQVVYTTSGTNATASKGIQQPYEISIITGFREEAASIIDLSVFPNPTTDLLTLEVKDFHGDKLMYQLTDLQGKEIENKKITSGQNLINLTNFSASTYFINVFQDTKQIQTFKIIKK